MGMVKHYQSQQYLIHDMKIFQKLSQKFQNFQIKGSLNESSKSSYCYCIEMSRKRKLYYIICQIRFPHWVVNITVNLTLNPIGFLNKSQTSPNIPKRFLVSLVGRVSYNDPPIYIPNHNRYFEFGHSYERNHISQHMYFQSSILNHNYVPLLS